jgi:hypothetical protein
MFPDKTNLVMITVQVMIKMVMTATQDQVTGDMNGSINQLGDLNVANTFQGQLHI